MNDIQLKSPNFGLFKSFFIAGFECSIHRNGKMKRLDLVASTEHDRYAVADYRRMADMGMFTAREGMRWHLIEASPERYDFRCMDPLIAASRVTGAEIIWDLCHFGWPDGIDPMDDAFIERAALFAKAACRYVMQNLPPPYYFVPINEISFMAWIGGQEGKINPYLTGKGFDLKCQLVRAAIAMMDAIREDCPKAIFVHTDPIINVIAHPSRPQDAENAERYRLAQYEAWDMLSGRSHPELGGNESYLGVIGANFYIHNQWYHDVEGNLRAHRYDPIHYSEPQYRPLSSMLLELYKRYNKPIFIAETGAEGEARAPWLKYVSIHVRAALYNGIPVHGICLYPILNHPGWEDDRHCYNGLWDYADGKGHRDAYKPLAEEIMLQSNLFSLDHLHPLQISMLSHGFLASDI